MIEPLQSVRARGAELVPGAVVQLSGSHCRVAGRYDLRQIERDDHGVLLTVHGPTNKRTDPKRRYVRLDAVVKVVSVPRKA